MASSKYSLEASKTGESRARNHWAPRLIATGEAVSTNDPGTTLISTLSSRSLQTTDLNPGLMNQPDRQWFKRGGITLDWALFEGGASTAFLKGAKLETVSHEFALKAKTSEEYAKFTSNYSKLISLESEIRSYEELQEKLKSFINKYRLGSKENPVGYSGLLGMRALLNRIEGYLDQSKAEFESIRQTIKIKSGIESLKFKVPKETNAPQFIDAKLVFSGVDEEKRSLSATATLIASEAAEKFASAEKARWLPKVGLFATGNLTSGPRDTGTSTEYGAYFQWELFNARNIGIQKQASLRAESGKERAAEFIESSKINRETLKNNLPVILENLKRSQDSLNITAEQITVTQKLFNSGSINALQFAEVLSRRADVIQGRRLIEYAYIENKMADYLENTGGK